MHNENTKKTGWKIAKERDVQEIQDVLEYVKGLVIKNQDEADENETLDMMRERTKYISAIRDLNDIQDFRNQIIEGYVERNPYYIFLEENYGISYYEASIAPHMTIIKSTNPTLSDDDRYLFNSCYNSSLAYFNRTTSTKAFDNQQYKQEFFQLMVLNHTVQRYLTYKLDNYFDIDKYDRYQLKNSFISYGFDYFDIIPTNYQRRLLKLLNELVMSKGTNEDILKLLDIFNFKNIDIFMYILAKLYPLIGNGESDYDNPYLVFYKTKATDIIDYDRDMILDYDSITEGDVFWKVDKEDVLHHRELDKDTIEYKILDDRSFNTIISKYMSVDFTTDILKQGQKLSYFMSLLYMFERDYKDKKGEDFGFINHNMSKDVIDLFTAITAYISLVIRQWKLEDEINLYPDLNVNIYGYNHLEDNVDIQGILDEIMVLLIQNKNELEYSRSFRDLYTFFEQFNLKGFNEPLCNLTAESLYQSYDQDNDIQRQLNGGLSRYIDDVAFNEFVMNDDNDLFDRLNFVRVYILRGTFKAKYVGVYPSLMSLLQKYILLEGFRNPPTRIQISDAFLNDKDLIKEIKQVVNVVNTAEIKLAYDDGDYYRVYDLANVYNVERRKKLMKDYHLDTDLKLEAFVRNDESDIGFYKEFTNFFKLFYEPFKGVNKNRKFNIQDFVEIFKMNEVLRDKIEAEIGNRDYNVYSIYKKYLEIWDKKFLSKLDTSVYKNCIYFSDYVKLNSPELYEWIFPDKFTEFKDDKERKEWFQSKIFDLAESIDTYIGAFGFFEDFPFSGISDFIIKILYLVITVFKSYTIDLLNSNMVWTIDDDGFNSIRLFDEIGSEEETDTIIMKVSLEDVIRSFEHDAEYDKTLKDTLKDSFTITEEIDPNGPSGNVPLPDGYKPFTEVH